MKETIIDGLSNKKVVYYIGICLMVLIGYAHLWPQLQQFTTTSAQDPSKFILLTTFLYMGAAFITTALTYLAVAGSPIKFRNKKEMIFIATTSPALLLGALGFQDYIGLDYSLLILAAYILVGVIDHWIKGATAGEYEEEE